MAGGREGGREIAIRFILSSCERLAVSDWLTACRSAGSVSILPTVLYLLLGVFRELVHLPTPAGNTRTHTHTDTNQITGETVMTNVIFTGQVHWINTNLVPSY